MIIISRLRPWAVTVTVTASATRPAIMMIRDKLRNSLLCWQTRLARALRCPGSDSAKDVSIAVAIIRVTVAAGATSRGPEIPGPGVANLKGDRDSGFKPEEPRVRACCSTRGKPEPSLTKHDDSCPGQWF
jgi:hypothetical protein